MKSHVKAELDRLTDTDAIIPFDQLIDWNSRMVVVTIKSGDLRICLDPRPLNKVLKHERYPLPVMEDTLPKLANAKVFLQTGSKQCLLACSLGWRIQSSYCIFRDPVVTPCIHYFCSVCIREWLGFFFFFVDDKLLLGFNAPEKQSKLYIFCDRRTNLISFQRSLILPERGGGGGSYLSQWSCCRSGVQIW